MRVLGTPEGVGEGHIDWCRWRGAGRPFLGRAGADSGAGACTNVQVLAHVALEGDGEQGVVVGGGGEGEEGGEPLQHPQGPPRLLHHLQAEAPLYCGHPGRRHSGTRGWTTQPAGQETADLDR